MFDLILHRGRVVGHSHDAVAVRDGRIAAVGPAPDLLGASPGARRIDLGGRTLVPGFNDAHAHVWKMGDLLTRTVDLRGVTSIPELVRRLRDRAAAGDGWLLGRGFNEVLLAERRLPTRADLEAIGRPVVLTRACGHICVANTAALEAAGVTRDTPAPGGGVIARDASGEPTGVLHETAVGVVTRAIPAPEPGEYARMVDAALRHQLAHGITSTSDCGVLPELLSVYLRMDAEGALAARVNVMPLRKPDGRPLPPLPARHVSDRLRIDTMKFLADGGLSGATAALRTSYRHANERGVLRFETGELLELCRESHSAGWRLATHAIGDAAIDQVLDVYEALGDHPRAMRHRIEHLGLPDAAQLARAARLRVIAAPQTIFLSELGANFRRYLPDDLLARCYPVRSMLDAGVTVALSSDAPVVEDDRPLAGMMAACTRRDADGREIAAHEAITRAEALAAYTIGGAIASGDEQNRGEIHVGRWADLVVLSDNPLTIDPDRLTDVRVDLTLVGGRVAYER